jgi:1-aminocyclopropane-1-carboxylate deaminase/D-cysteine desulfhydrase-like pyridoxal-dependent ACC family enzyme
LNDRIELLRRRASALPRIPLTPLPTPLQECRHLSQEVGHGVRLFLKRDDLTAIGLGGNKVRKLEFSLGEAKAEGCDAIVHGLAGQSNYCRQTAAACAMLGIPCYLVLRRDHKTDGPPQGNLLLDHLFGAHVTLVAPEDQPRAKQELVERLKAEGRKPYLIGHHDEVLGAVAYSLCLAEVIEQLAEHGLRADAVCVSGSYGTQAGLVLGKRLLGLEGEVLGFNVMPLEPASTSLRLARTAGEAAKQLGFDESFSPGEIRNTPAYAGEQYGKPTPECLEAMSLLGRTEGLVVGPVYTAKGLAGTLDYVRTGRIAPGSTVVFIHTGGTPEVFAYNAELMRPASEG